MARLSWLRVALLTLLIAFPTLARAQAQANVEINTPAIGAIQKSMQERHAQLQPLYASGAVGLTRDGNVALRDANAVPLPQRAQANALVAAENQDRAALYREIARANGRPEWENDIRSTFAQRWIDKAQPGWYYQNASGAWVRK
jgi:uncharacterized protein YdbL (DUF1318 family)